MDGNRSKDGSGGIAMAGGVVTMDRCTIINGSVSRWGGGLYVNYQARLTVKNCIIWGNSPNQIQIMDPGLSRLSVTWSDIPGWPNTGNIAADPLFVDPSNGDYRLQSTSPCIDAGDPASPLDLDGTRADMGALPANTRKVILPRVFATSDTSMITIRASAMGLTSANLAFTVDTTLIDSVWIENYAFEGQVEEMASANLYRDTVFVAMLGSAPVDLDGNVLVTLGVTLRDGASYGTSVLAWVGYPATFLNESAPSLVNGSFAYMEYVFGDVTENGEITSLDAAWILQYNVRKRFDVSEIIADVSSNDLVTAFDAALIIRKVLDPLYLFPVEGGTLSRPASVTRYVAFRVNGDAATLEIDDPTGVIAADLVVNLGSNTPVEVTAPGMVQSNQDGSTLRVSLIRDDDGTMLLSLAGADPALISLESISLNEGRILVDAMTTPKALDLAQNAPNPFNPVTTITYSLPASAHTSITVYSVTGQQVRMLVNSVTASGTHSVVWDGRDAVGRPVASGVYLYRLVSGTNVMTRRMVLVR